MYAFNSLSLGWFGTGATTARGSGGLDAPFYNVIYYQEFANPSSLTVIANATIAPMVAGETREIVQFVDLAGRLGSFEFQRFIFTVVVDSNNAVISHTWV